MPDNTPADASWEQFVPEGTRENYRQIARDRAKTEGTSPKAELAKLRKGFDEQHKTDALGGWDHLAAWAKADPDPGDGSVKDDAIAREVESAKRDPRAALRGSPEAVKAAKDELERREKESTPGQDIDGVIPNPGPAAV